MDDLVSQAEEFFKNAGKDAEYEKLREIRASILNDYWRVCIAGGFSRGKTRLLNLLLDTDLFPEDVVPATTVLTEVSYAPTPRVEFAGVSETISLEPVCENLERFCAGNEFADAKGIIRVGYPASFLQPDLMLRDTPGIDDLLASRADIAFDALQQSDGALVVTSALAPLGITERQFIESSLLSRHIPRIAIVVTFLDQLDSGEAARALKNVRAIVSRMGNNIEIWCAETGPGTEICDARGLDAMRKRIHAWTNAENRERKRQKRALAAIYALLQNSLAADEALARSMAEDMWIEEDTFRKASQELEDNADGWSDLRSRFMTGGEVCIDKLKDLARRMASKMATETARENFESHPRVLLEEFSREIAALAQKCIDEDMERLLSGIRQKYGIAVAMPCGIKITPTGKVNEEGDGFDWYLLLALDFVEKHLDDIVLFVPLPPAGRALAREMGRRLVMLGKDICGSGDSVQAANRFVNDITREITASVREIYAQTGERARTMQLAWLNEQKSRLQLASGNSLREDRISRLNDNIHKAKDILKKITEVVKAE